MSKRIKKKEFRLTLKVIIRLVIFFIIIYLFINYFSSQKLNSNQISSNILGEQTTSPSDMPLVKTVIDSLYSQLPPQSQSFIENLNNSPIFEYTQNKLEFIKTESSGFPQKQIKDFKLYVLNKGQSMLKGAVDKTK